MIRYESSALVTILAELSDPCRDAARLALGHGSWSVIELASADAPPALTRRILVAIAASLGPAGVRAIAEWCCILAAAAADVQHLDSTRRRDDARLCEFHADTAAVHAVAALRASLVGTPFMDRVTMAAAHLAAEHAALASMHSDGEDAARRQLSSLANRIESIPPAATQPPADQLGGDLLGIKEVLALAAELALTDRPTLITWSRHLAASEIVGGDPIHARRRAELVADASATLSAARSAAACFGWWQSTLAAACPYLDTANRKRFIAAEVDAQIAALHRACVAARRDGGKSQTGSIHEVEVRGTVTI